ncbi:S-layer homology domain-containing protein [Rossellomorea sp. YZS02]|uniref:S-layer homology domain-containing protein n=1 Tax=Rossellomorea sp. YZS02 TaxID=3097358 RepID=UPI002A172371|nr:S-layer homology domain-containing protein [Rossellomorea sp. YZS02]MDX8344137.1 S-layer homology domain-containing protein [Rossellomorea sp. YZS02]
MKRLATSLLAAVMVIGIITPFSASAKGFTDVPTTHTFFDEITYLSDQEIINGFNDGTFAPGKPVTRAAAAAMIGRAIGLDGEQRATTFDDVGESNFASGYIQSAVESKIISGYTDGTFKPGKIVTRGEMAIFLARAFDLTVKAETSFSDVSPSMAASDSILQILAERITSGYTDGTYRPNQDVTRDQFSAFLARALDDRFKQDPVPVPGNLTITSVNLDTEVVQIKNNGNNDVNMTGWKLVSVEGNQTYDFPANFILKAGSTVHVTSGQNAVHNPPAYLKWTGGYIWNNEGDTARLVNAEGVNVSEY